jgi:hypothetical protein
MSECVEQSEQSMSESDSDCSGSDRVTSTGEQRCHACHVGLCFDCFRDYHTKLNTTLLFIIFIRVLFQK